VNEKLVGRAAKANAIAQKNACGEHDQQKRLVEAPRSYRRLSQGAVNSCKLSTTAKGLEEKSHLRRLQRHGYGYLFQRIR
jgi:hypothetical protein